MATLTTNTTATGLGLTGRLTALVSSFNAYRARRAIYRRTLTELSAMSERELDDLGISPYMIPEIARESAGL